MYYISCVHTPTGSLLIIRTRGGGRGGGGELLFVTLYTSSLLDLKTAAKAKHLALS